MIQSYSIIDSGLQYYKGLGLLHWMRNQSKVQENNMQGQYCPVLLPEAAAPGPTCLGRTSVPTVIRNSLSEVPDQMRFGKLVLFKRAVRRLIVTLLYKLVY